jgi:Na+-driven multidrug efflux pump
MAGAGATFESLVLDVIVLLGVVLPAAYFVAVLQELPRQALWQVVAWGNVLSAAVYLLYYARGRFLKVSRTEVGAKRM